MRTSRSPYSGLMNISRNSSWIAKEIAIIVSLRIVGEGEGVSSRVEQLIVSELNSRCTEDAGEVDPVIELRVAHEIGSEASPSRTVESVVAAE